MAPALALNVAASACERLRDLCFGDVPRAPGATLRLPYKMYGPSVKCTGEVQRCAASIVKCTYVHFVWSHARSIKDPVLVEEGAAPPFFVFGAEIEIDRAFAAKHQVDSGYRNTGPDGAGTRCHNRENENVNPFS